MPPFDTIAMLIGRGGEPRDPLDPAQWKCAAARLAWARDTAAAWLRAQQEMDRRCSAAVDRVSKEEFDRLFEAKQAKVAALRAQLDAVIDDDRWPPHLHFGGI